MRRQLRSPIMVFACVAASACWADPSKIGMETRASPVSARRVMIPPGPGGAGYSILIPTDLQQQLTGSASPEVVFKGNGIFLRLGLPWDIPSCPAAPSYCREMQLRVDGREARSVSVDVSMPGFLYDRRVFYQVNSSARRPTYIDAYCVEAACARVERIVESVKFN